MRRLAAAAFLLVVAPALLVAQDKPAAAKAPAPRVLYVIDVESEAPLAGAQVHDMMTRNSMKTSKDGVVGLLVPDFVKKDGALIEVSLAGYRRSERVFVDPLSDTTAIVIALLKEGSSLPTLVVDSTRQAFARQRHDSTVFQVIVFSEAGPALPGASIVIARMDSTVLASRISDTTGLRTIAIPETRGNVRITVQRIGYRPYVQAARLDAADTVVAPVAMRQLVPMLAGVRVTAKKSLYHLDADQIATDTSVTDALDAIRKLRPEMFGDKLRSVPGCGRASVVWVNGQRIAFPPRNVDLPPLPRKANMSVVYVDVKAPGGGTRRIPVRKFSLVGEAAMFELVRAVLWSIKPEHVAEMTYSDCFDTTFARLHTDNAIFVVLKPDIEYTWDRGSIAKPDSTTRR